LPVWPGGPRNSGVHRDSEKCTHFLLRHSSIEKFVDRSPNAKYVEPPFLLSCNSRIEPDAPQHFEVLFEDSHLLAVNKPSGLPTLPGGGFMENTLLRLVQKQIPNANPVHRLGRATTGIVLFAKTPQAASKLGADWNTPRIQKIYCALAQNTAQHDAYEILTPIGLVPHPRIGSVWAANPSGKPSKSLTKVISRTTSSTTFEVGLCSGRPHQIRIHLASIGHPPGRRSSVRLNRPAS
jgi:23S rRNA pseudouridine1911/1915/1917 synthase